MSRSSNLYEKNFRETTNKENISFFCEINMHIYNKLRTSDQKSFHVQI